MSTGQHQFGSDSVEEKLRVRPMEFPSAPPAASLSHSNSPLPPAFAGESEKRIRELEGELAALRSGLTGRMPAASEREAYELGRAEGLAESAKVRQRVLEEMARQLEQAIKSFQASEENYLHQVEQEVVRLALSIASRVLRREAAADPLLLSGAVRVALGQLSETAEVRLRIPEREEELWQEMIRLTPNLPHRPQLIADGAMLAGECLLVSSMGTIDLGVNSQLAEIERGLIEHSTSETRSEAASEQPTGLRNRAEMHRRRRDGSVVEGKIQSERKQDGNLSGASEKSEAGEKLRRRESKRRRPLPAKSLVESQVESAEFFVQEPGESDRSIESLAAVELLRRTEYDQERSELP